MVTENVIDMAHVPYVHAGTVGDHAAFVDVVIETTDTALNFAFPIENHREGGAPAAFHVDTRATACLPSTSFIRFHLPFGLRLVTINSIVPIDAETTVIRFCQMRNFLRIAAIDPIIRQCAPASPPLSYPRALRGALQGCTWPWPSGAPTPSAASARAEAWPTFWERTA